MVNYFNYWVYLVTIHHCKSVKFRSSWAANNKRTSLPSLMNWWSVLLSRLFEQTSSRRHHWHQKTADDTVLFDHPRRLQLRVCKPSRSKTSIGCAVDPLRILCNNQSSELEHIRTSYLNQNCVADLMVALALLDRLIWIDRSKWIDRLIWIVQYGLIDGYGSIVRHGLIDR